MGGPARPMRLLTDASELAVSAILERPDGSDDAGDFCPVASESRKLQVTLTRPERSYPPYVLEPLAVVHGLNALCPYLPNQPWGCTPTARACSGRQCKQQRHAIHRQARRLNLLSEYQYGVVHIPARTNPADFLNLNQQIPRRPRPSALHGLRLG